MLSRRSAVLQSRRNSDMGDVTSEGFHSDEVGTISDSLKKAGSISEIDCRKDEKSSACSAKEGCSAVDERNDIGRMRYISSSS